MNSANKFKKICLLIFAFLMMGIAAKAVERPYAVYDSNGTLTFKYGEKPSGQFVFDVTNTNYNPEWWALRASVYKVVFESSFSESRPGSCHGWFCEMTSLSKIEGIEYLNTSNVTDMSQMFYDCSSLTSLDVSGFNTSKVKDMSYMFDLCSSLTSLDVRGFNTSNVTDMQYMFNSCSGLTSLDVSGFNTSKVTNMFRMFFGCSGLTSLDVSGFNTSNVTDMSHMFYQCEKLTSLDVSGFNTSKVTDMQFMFSKCSSLTSLDVSGFNTSKVADMQFMFNECSSLTSLDVSGFNTVNVTNMEYAFSKCSSLTSLDVSSFNTSNVNRMRHMFAFCSGLASLDVRGFNTSNVNDMIGMFRGCKQLAIIYCNTAWDCEYSEDMFLNSTNLCGAICYRGSYDNDVTYANPTTGYFTYKAPETRALSINGTTVTDINERNLTTIDGVTGTARYDNPSKTLTLTDAMIFTAADNTSAIQTNLDSLYIVVNGECMIGSTKLAGITGTSHVVIKGSGKLTVVGVNAVVLLQNLGSLTVTDGVQLDIQGYREYGINGCKALKVSGKDTKLSISGTTGSCTNLGALTLTDNLAIMDPLGAKYSNGTIVDIDGNEIKYYWVTIEYAEPYDLTLNGTQVTAANNSILNTLPGVTGTASYDPDTKTLYLEDASITELTSTGGYAIKTTLDTLRVNVEGECNISSSNGVGLHSNSRNVVIGGTGTLNIDAGTAGIVMNNTSTNTLNIDGKVTVNVTADNYGVQGREYEQRQLNGTTRIYYRTTLKVGGEGSKLSVNGTAKCFQTLGGFIPADGYEVTAPSRTAFYGTSDGVDYYTFCRLSLSFGKELSDPTTTLTPVAGTAVVIEKPYILGDVNGDGSITMADANAVVNYFLSTDPSSITNFNVCKW